MIKLTILYGHPTDPEAFEKYYANTHSTIAAQIKGHTRSELTKFISAPDGSKAAYYRMAEFWFSNIESLQATMGSPEGQAALADLPNFATGGVTPILGSIDSQF